VAAGVAAGAFTSFTPFMGLHFLLAAILAWVIRGNLIASALGTFVGNPLTFPFIWAATYKTGQFILQADMAGAPPALGHAMKRVMSSLWNLDGTAAMTALSNIWNPILYPMLVGGLIVGPLVTIPMYFLTKRAALMFRESRRDKLMNKAAEIKARARAAASSIAFTPTLKNKNQIAAKNALRLTPNVLLQRKPAQKLWEQGFQKACFGATWAWSICQVENPRWN
jgi:uncharacterized protein (DUF2062 family)